MKKFNLLFLLLVFFVGISINISLAQGQYELYTVPQNGSQDIKIENGKLYRVTIKSCWYSADARMGTYLVFGLNIADPKISRVPKVLTVSETESTDWSFSYSLNGDHDANMTIASTGWGDQGLSVVVESVFPEQYSIVQNASQDIKIENGKLYRVTIKSCWYSADARMGTYLVFGLNIADPKTSRVPKVLTVSETESTDWSFSYSLNGDHDANMTIASTGWGDQGLSVVVESVFPEQYSIVQNASQDIKIENGKLYRVTIKSCWYSADARMGTYLVFGLNIADPKTSGVPKVLTVSETESTDWSFSYSLNGDHDANMTIASTGWGDQGLSVVIEPFSNPSSSGWSDDFESNTVGSQPSNWIFDANGIDTKSNYIDNAISYQGTKSLKLFGSVGVCWGRSSL